MGVYSGVLQENLLVEGGNFNKVTVTDSVVATAALWVPTYTAAEIADIGSAANTTAKAAGALVFDTTNSKLKVATGGDANSTWVDADGTVAVTPS